ncbi:MAG: helix-turn-helix transcriptional regulator [Fastidiosipilaceae bacterium]
MKRRLLEIIATNLALNLENYNSVCSSASHTMEGSLDYFNLVKDQPVGIFIIKIDNLHQENSKLVSFALKWLVPTVKSVLSNHCSVIESITVFSRVYWLFQFDSERKCSELDLYVRVIKKFNNIPDEYKNMSLTLCPAKSMCTIDNLQYCLSNAERSVRLRLISDHDHIVMPYKFNDLKVLRVSDVFSPSQQAVFHTVIESGEIEWIVDYISKLFLPLVNIKERNIDPIILFELSHRILIMIGDLLESQNIESDTQGVYNTLGHASTVQEYVKIFLQKVEFLMNPYALKMQSYKNSPVNRAIYYINNHYSTPISLTEVADFVDLSPSYFSALFKKETGKSFSEYLTLCGMNKAKKLLTETMQPIGMISDSVGYSDAKYFSKVFTKYFNMSPQRYRKIN